MIRGLLQKVKAEVEPTHDDWIMFQEALQGADSVIDWEGFE